MMGDYQQVLFLAGAQRRALPFIRRDRSGQEKKKQVTCEFCPKSLGVLWWYPSHVWPEAGRDLLCISTGSRDTVLPSRSL